MSDIKERLRKGIITGDILSDCCDYRHLCEEAADHIATLEASVAANQKDAERLDFLLLEHCVIQEFSVRKEAVYNLNWYESGEQQREVYKSPREAIDAAMVADTSTQEVG